MVSLKPSPAHLPSLIDEGCLLLSWYSVYVHSSTFYNLVKGWSWHCSLRIDFPVFRACPSLHRLNCRCPLAKELQEVWMVHLGWGWGSWSIFSWKGSHSRMRKSFFFLFNFVVSLPYSYILQRVRFPFPLLNRKPPNFTCTISTPKWEKNGPFSRLKMKIYHKTFPRALLFKSPSFDWILSRQKKKKLR